MSIKRTLRVTIEKLITVELPDKVATPEWLAEFNKFMWPIEGIDDVAKYAARMAAIGSTGCELDALGLVDYHYSTYPRVPDVKVWEHDESIEEEVVESWVFKEQGT